MSIILQYMAVNGEKNTKGFPEDTENIDLNEMNIKSIVLTPFGEFRKLKSINLPPLGLLKQLRTIDFWDNPATKVDISPLKECSKLKQLVMSKPPPIEWYDAELDEKTLPKILRKTFFKEIKAARDCFLMDQKQ